MGGGVSATRIFPPEVGVGDSLNGENRIYFAGRCMMAEMTK